MPVIIRTRLAPIVVVAAALAPLGSCPDLEGPADGRTLVLAMFEASVVCFPTFLAEAEPVFLQAQASAQIEAAVVSFDRTIANPKVSFSRAAYNECLASAQENDCDAISSDTGPCANVFRGLGNDRDVCAEGVECAPGLDCFQERGACGLCRPIGFAGESCVDRNCRDEDFCNENDICAAKPTPQSFEVGSLCSLASGCGGLLSGLVCIDGECAPMTVVDEGEGCEVGLIATRYCRNTSTTHSCLSDLCVPRPGLDEPCNQIGACDAREAACVDSACVDEGQPGDECANGLGCRLGSACKENVCTLLTDVPAPPTCG